MNENTKILKAIYYQIKDLKDLSHKNFEIIQDIQFRMVDKVNELDLKDAFELLKKNNNKSIDDLDDLEEIKRQLKKKIENELKL